MADEITKRKEEIIEAKIETYSKEDGKDNRMGTSYRTIQIGKPEFGLFLEIHEKSPLYNATISEINLYLKGKKNLS